MNALVRECAPVRVFQRYVPPAAAAILTLEPGACHWPLGDMSSVDFRFCLASCRIGSYCDVHRRLAFRRVS